MNMIENKAAGKRRTPKAGVMVLAAALAVGCLLSIAAGLPARVYNFMSGGSVTNMPGSDAGIMVVASENPVTLENGRIWLTVNGEKLDITDKMDDSTPYIVKNTDEENGTSGYFIAGGTPENFGWVELPVIDGAIVAVSGSNYQEHWFTGPDGTEINLNSLPVEERLNLVAEDGIIFTAVEQPWLQAAFDQLGLHW